MSSFGTVIPKQINRANTVAEDASFEVGDSPVVITVGGGQISTTGYLICDGPGDILVEISRNGTSYDTQFTLKQDNVLDLDNLHIKKIRITHSGTDSAYRANIL